MHGAQTFSAVPPGCTIMGRYRSRKERRDEQLHAAGRRKVIPAGPHTKITAICGGHVATGESASQAFHTAGRQRPEIVLVSVAPILYGLRRLGGTDDGITSAAHRQPPGFAACRSRRGG